MAQVAVSDGNLQIEYEPWQVWLFPSDFGGYRLRLFLFSRLRRFVFYRLIQLDYISTLQEELVRATVLPEDYDFEGHRELVGMQPGDVPVTYADSEALERDYGFRPTIGIRDGLRKFAEWYKGYYKASQSKQIVLKKTPRD